MPMVVLNYPDDDILVQLHNKSLKAFVISVDKYNLIIDVHVYLSEP